MINWIKKKLGYHVCEEFTQWQTMQATYERPCKFGDGNPWLAGQLTIEYTVRFQERQCTLCGKIQQRFLDNGLLG